MSPREEAQRKVAEYLRSNPYFSAPYGVLEGLAPFGKGKARTVTFGVARYLDATVTIFSPTRLVVRGRGGLARKFEGEFPSADALVEHLAEESR